ncbi:bacterioferritin [Skermanella pratensis]|uniref:bacterioferritin n=1 Tax=Skermanella pratensis TaxID=2233999 RepID=UPI0013012159|nr:bacterioferritin [Skermanella pratensis]
MKGDPGVIRHLNKILTGKLTAVNQYFLHARMLKDWGLERLADHSYQESISKMKHADRLIERILFLEGMPNLQDLNKIKTGNDVPEMVELEMETERNGRESLLEAIEVTEQIRDFITRELFTDILTDTEEHIDWLTHQLRLIDGVGRENYKQEQMFKGS